MNIINDSMIYIDVNLIPSRYALDVTFLPNIIVDIRMDIIGIKILIKLVCVGRK